MNLQSKHQKSNVQAYAKEAKNPLVNPEPNAKVTNSFLDKQQELTNFSQDKGNTAANPSNILNSKDLEIFNNIANKITNNNSISNAAQKKKKVLNKNASSENIKGLIDHKNKEMEIYNKINNFSLKYSNGQSQNLNMNNSTLLSQRSVRRKSQQDSVDFKSISRNATPNKKQNLNNVHSNNNSVCNYNNNNIQNISNASFNNSLLLHGFNNNNDNFSKITNNSNNLAANAALSQSNYLTDKSASKLKKGGDSVHPHKISKINPISPEDFENCHVSDEDDHLPQAPCGASEKQLNRSIVLKPKPPLELNNYLSKEFANIPVIEEESGAECITVIEGEFKPAAFLPEVKSAFYDIKKNMSSGHEDVEKDDCEVNNENNPFVNAERNNKELLKALTHMEHEINKSEFNNGLHSKSLISNIDEVLKHFENYDLTHLSYDLVKEYSHLRIDKDEEFMKRMLFDIFKRQTKDERLEKIMEKNKVKMDENERIKAFNRLIEDANRRLEAQEKIEDLKVKLNKGIEDEKNYTSKDWEEIYQQRFKNYQSYRENWVRERQSEKELMEKEKEQEIIKSCKTVRKPKKSVEEFCNRMYDEAKRRQIKNLKKKENYENEEEKDLVASANFTKNNNNINNKYDNKKAPLENNKDLSKGKSNKATSSYNFQSDFNSIQISENEANKKYSKLATFREQSQKSLNFSMELIQNLNQSPIENRSKSKENLNLPKGKFENTPIKLKRDSDSKLSNTELNNMRFECDPSESKRNLINRNSSSLLSVSQENKQKDFGVYEFSTHKTPVKAAEDFTANLFSANIKNMHDIQNNNFDISDEEIIQDVPQPYKIRAKKPSYKIVPVMFSNTQMKFLPDHVAKNVVDNILNPKIYDD